MMPSRLYCSNRRAEVMRLKSLSLDGIRKRRQERAVAAGGLAIDARDSFNKEIVCQNFNWRAN